MTTQPQYITDDQLQKLGDALEVMQGLMVNRQKTPAVEKKKDSRNLRIGKYLNMIEKIK
jgi:hypothetical protein